MKYEIGQNILFLGVKALAKTFPTLKIYRSLTFLSLIFLGELYDFVIDFGGLRER